MAITCRPGQQLGFLNFCVHGYHHDVGPLRLGQLLAGPSASGKCVPTQRGARNTGPKEGSMLEHPLLLLKSHLTSALGSKPGPAVGAGLQWGWRSLERNGELSSFSLLHFEFYRNIIDLQCGVCFPVQVQTGDSSIDLQMPSFWNYCY